MPPQRKPARLWLRPPEGPRAAEWIILDAGKQIRTRCGPGDRERAERALQRHISAKGRPAGSARHPDQVTVAEVLAFYAQDCVMAQARPKEALGRVERLLDWWKVRPVSGVNGKACRAYTEHRGAAAARRELEDLRAAINHAAVEGVLEYPVKVALPPKSAPRERWLTRSELAKLIWAAWTYREVQKGHQTDKRPRRHVARFILVAYYTGTRSGAVCAASMTQIDTEHCIFYRRPEGEAETKKRRPPAPLSKRLVAHVRRWKRLGISRTHLIEYRGKPVASVKKAFAAAVAAAKLEEVTPHILRHTAATHLMQRGESLEDASQFLGMTVETLRENYWHHHPDYGRSTADRLGFRCHGNETSRKNVNRRETSAAKA